MSSWDKITELVIVIVDIQNLSWKTLILGKENDRIIGVDTFAKSL